MAEPYHWNTEIPVMVFQNLFRLKLNWNSYGFLSLRLQIIAATGIKTWETPKNWGGRGLGRIRHSLASLALNPTMAPRISGMHSCKMLLRQPRSTAAQF